MIEIVSRYPFLLALAGALVIDLSAIFVRRAAHTLDGWVWYLAGVLSSLGAITLLWSLLWANTPDMLAQPRGGAINLLLGPLLILAGVVWLVRAILALGRQAYFPWPPTRLVTQPPYRERRRPMTLGWAMLAAGLALTTVRIEGWMWFGVWALLSQPLLELEEWELRKRTPDAKIYFENTPRYVKFPER